MQPGVSASAERMTDPETAMTELRIELLGGFAARGDDDSPLVLPTRKAQALLAYLALPAGQFHGRDSLAALLWGDTPETQARQSLRQALSALRRAIGSELLLSNGDRIALDGERVGSDVADLERATANASVKALEQATAGYRGDFLDGLRLDETAFDEWRAIERERLRELALSGLQTLLDRHRDGGRMSEAIATAQRMLAIDPAREGARRDLMRLLLDQGRRAAALAQYQACVDWLDRELGVAPEAETRQLYRDILQAAATTSEGARSETGTVSEEAPMVGRAPEAAILGDALARTLDDGGRIALVQGEAGIGKSRLIREFVAAAGRQGIAATLTTCHETEQILPLRAWIDSLRDGGDTLHADLRARLDPATSTQLARVFPELSRGGGDGVVAHRARQVRLVDHIIAQLRRRRRAQSTLRGRSPRPS